MSSFIHIPVTYSEETELARRDAVTNAMPALRTALADVAPESFLDVWFDQQAGGILRISATANFSVSSGLIESCLPAGTSFTINTVPYDRSELDAVQARLESDWTTFRSEGIDISQFSVDVTTGRINVQLNADSVGAAETQLADKYGPTLLITRVDQGYEPEASRYASTGRIFGGQAIVSTGTNRNICTASTTAVGEYGYFVITAGHCGNHVNFTRGQNSPGSPIGQGYNNGWFQTYDGATHCDCQDIGTVPASEATNSVIIPNNQTYAYTSLATESDYSVGRMVCATGVAYDAEDGNADDGDISCGPITNGSTAVNLTASTALFDCFTSSLASVDGDSGSPIGSGPTYMGVLSGHYGSTDTVMSKSLYIQQVTGATPILSQP